MIPSNIKALILDMDGVIWKADAPIGDLPSTFKRIRERGLKFVFATNNGTKTPEEYQQKLAELGVEPVVALNVLEALKDRSAAVADVFIELFNDQVWQPFDDVGRPSEDWPRVQEALGRGGNGECGAPSTGSAG